MVVDEVVLAAADVFLPDGTDDVVFLFGSVFAKMDEARRTLDETENIFPFFFSLPFFLVLFDEWINTFDKQMMCVMKFKRIAFLENHKSFMRHIDEVL